MQIQIKNIGNIGKANITLDGLTVVAGNNDTGKSTVSKVIFSVIKALRKYKEFSEVSKESIIKKNVDDLYLDLRAIFSITNEDKENKNKLLNFDEIKNYFEPTKFIEGLEENGTKSYFEEKIKIINNFKIKPGFLLVLLNDLKKIEKEYFIEETKKYLVKNALNVILKSEFKGQLNTAGKKGEINISEGKISLLNIDIKNNKVSNVDILDDIMKIKDSTFTETPIFLNLFNELPDDMGRFQYHFQDLFKKIKSIDNKDNLRKNGFWKKVKKVIGGSFEVKKKIAGHELSFNKEGLDNNIHTINTATGIKAFGILDLLDQADNLNSDDLLILDEPEVHLHPEWQVKYAELIVALIKERDLSVLITSHSPYMIEALNKFSKNEDKIKASFYLAEKNEKGGYNINDKTNEKSLIFKKLSEPFENLIWN